MVKEVLITHYPHIIPPIKPYLQSICPNLSNYINHHQPHNPFLPFRPILGRPCHRWLHGPPPCCTAVGPELHSSAAWHETNFHPSRCCRSPRRPSRGNPWQPGGVKPQERGFFTRVGTPETFLFWYDSYRHTENLEDWESVSGFNMLDYVGRVFLGRLTVWEGMVLECLPRHSSKQSLAVGNQRKSLDKYGHSMGVAAGTGNLTMCQERSHDTLPYWRYISNQHLGYMEPGVKSMCIDLATPSSNPFKYPVPKGTMVLLPLSVEVRAVGFSAFWHPKIFGLATTHKRIHQELPRTCFNKRVCSIHSMCQVSHEKKTTPTFH